MEGNACIGESYEALRGSVVVDDSWNVVDQCSVFVKLEVDKGSELRTPCRVSSSRDNRNLH